MDATATFEIDAAALTDVGLCRTTNEDAVKVMRVTFDDSRSGIVAIVADGMGGHSAGDVASRIAVSVVEEELQRTGRFSPDALRRALVTANRAIFDVAARDTRFRGMGTTCTVIAVCEAEAHCAYVGDSRVYLCRGGQAYTMTRDHSSVGQMVADGLLTPEQARLHADRNVLLRALGTARDVDVTTWEDAFPLRAADRLVVCTDGVYGTMTDGELAAAATEGSARDACGGLVALARARGGHDNITTAVITVEGARQ